MATTDDDTSPATPESPRPPRSSGAGPGWMKPAKRYGPFVVVAVVVVAAIAVFGGGDDGDDSDGGGGGGGGGETAEIDREELIRSGPMTPERAELEGEEDVDFGPDCDPDTERIRIPTVYAPPCVVPFEGDNGGATSQGVTEDEILVVRYSTDPAVDPLFSAQVAATGADVNPETANQTIEDYVNVFQQVYETYGRRVRVVPFTGSGAGDDLDAARADAVEIADMGAFAVIGGPNRAGPAFSSALAERGVVCLGECTIAVPDSILQANQPYAWPTPPAPNQAAALASELIGKLAGPGPAELAGDENLRDQERVYGLLHFDNADGDYEEVTEALVDGLAEYDIEVTTDLRFELDVARAQDNARSMIAALEEDGVTTVIYTGDPVTPSFLTREATAQDYFPEWILAQSALADTAVFARSFDQQQWVNGFGISLPPARGVEETGDWYRVYDWAYGTAPPNNTYNVLAPQLNTLFTGIHLAGPELTPETFRDGLFRNPPAGGGPTSAQISRGDHGVWSGLDVAGGDDAAIIWWDPEASGEDEAGNQGVGLYRFANGGERYTIGTFPDAFEEAGLFDEESSVTIYEELPPEDRPPDYPPPDL